jgi:hypothetical protein
MAGRLCIAAAPVALPQSLPPERGNALKTERRSALLNPAIAVHRVTPIVLWESQIPASSPPWLRGFVGRKWISQPRGIRYPGGVSG